VHFDLGLLFARGRCAIKRFFLDHIFVRKLGSCFEIVSRGLRRHKAQILDNISLPRSMGLLECGVVKYGMFRFELSKQVLLSGTDYDFVIHVGLHSFMLAPMMPRKARMQLDEIREETYNVHYKFDIEGKVILQNASNDIGRNIIPGMAY
jgi:hypothetical protein